VRALDLAADRQQRKKLERLTIFTDAQAAITRMQTCEVGPGQQYALQARKALERIKCPVEIRWCPAHSGIEGNEIADGWAKLAAEEPDRHGVEWLRHSDNERRSMPLPASLAHLKRRIGDKKWKEAHEWSLARTKTRRFDVRRHKKATDPTPAKAPKRIAARFYQLKSGQALTATHMKKIKKQEDDQCWWCFRSKQTREHLFKHCSTWRSQQNAMWALVAKETKRRKRRWKMAELFADERCSGPILEFLRTTDVGRMVPPLRADTESEESAAEPECPRDGCGCDPGTTGVVAGDLGRRVFGLPPAAFGLVEFRGG